MYCISNFHHSLELWSRHHQVSGSAEHLASAFVLKFARHVADHSKLHALCPAEVFQLQPDVLTNPEGVISHWMSAPNYIHHYLLLNITKYWHVFIYYNVIFPYQGFAMCRYCVRLHSNKPARWPNSATSQSVDGGTISSLAVATGMFCRALCIFSCWMWVIGRITNIFIPPFLSNDCVFVLVFIFVEPNRSKHCCTPIWTIANGYAWIYHGWLRVSR